MRMDILKRVHVLFARLKRSFVGLLMVQIQVFDLYLSSN
jgi:hypothetical protein